MLELVCLAVAVSTSAPAAAAIATLKYTYGLRVAVQIGCLAWPSPSKKSYPREEFTIPSAIWVVI